MRVIGMGFLCERRGAPLFRCWPPVSPSPRAALFLGFTCFFSRLHHRSRSSLPTRALRLRYPCLAALRPLLLSRHLTRTHLLPAVTQRGVACLLLSVHFCELSLPFLFIHLCLPLVGFTYALL